MHTVMVCLFFYIPPNYNYVSVGQNFGLFYP